MRYNIGNNKEVSMYIDNEELQKELSGWKRRYDVAMAGGQEAPRISEKLGAYILEIARNYAKKHNKIIYHLTPLSNPQIYCRFAFIFFLFLVNFIIGIIFLLILYILS